MLHMSCYMSLTSGSRRYHHATIARMCDRQPDKQHIGSKKQQPQRHF